MAERRPTEDPPDPVLDEVFARFVRHIRAPRDFHTHVMARVDQQRARWWRWARRGGGAPRWVAAWTPALTVGVLLMLTFPLWGALFLPSAPSYRELERSLIEREKKEPPGIERPMVEPGLAVEDALYGLIQQGRAAEHQGDTTRAMAAYRRAIDQVAFPLNQLAWLLSLQPQTPEDQRALALPLARLAVQLRPDEAEYLDTLAVILCRVGEQAEAVQVMAQAAHLEPQKFGAKGARFRQGLCQ